MAENILSELANLKRVIDTENREWNSHLQSPPPSVPPEPADMSNRVASNCWKLMVLDNIRKRLQIRCDAIARRRPRKSPRYVMPSINSEVAKRCPESVHTMDPEDLAARGVLHSISEEYETFEVDLKRDEADITRDLNHLYLFHSDVWQTFMRAAQQCGINVNAIACLTSLQGRAEGQEFVTSASSNIQLERRQRAIEILYGEAQRNILLLKSFMADVGIKLSRQPQITEFFEPSGEDETASSTPSDTGRKRTASEIEEPDDSETNKSIEPSGSTVSQVEQPEFVESTSTRATEEVSDTVCNKRIDDSR